MRLRASESALEQLKRKSSGYVPNTEIEAAGWSQTRKSHDIHRWCAHSSSVSTLSGGKSEKEELRCKALPLSCHCFSGKLGLSFLVFAVEDAEVEGHHNSSRGHTTALVADRDGQRREAEPRVDTGGIGGSN